MVSIMSVRSFVYYRNGSFQLCAQVCAIPDWCYFSRHDGGARDCDRSYLEAAHHSHSQPLEPLQPAASGVKTGAAEGRQKDRILGTTDGGIEAGERGGLEPPWRLSGRKRMEQSGEVCTGVRTEGPTGVRCKMSSGVREGPYGGVDAGAGSSVRGSVQRCGRVCIE